LPEKFFTVGLPGQSWNSLLNFFSRKVEMQQ
jgi:hypothetical protein